MNIPARQIRDLVQDIPGLRPVLSPRQQRTREIILTAAVRTFAILGFKNVSMRAFAAGIWISRDRIQTHFLDMDSLLAEMLFAHLQGVSRAIGNAPRTPKDHRAAYYAYTRAHFGTMKREHAVFVFERENLPEDLLDGVESLHAGLGPMLCPEDPDRVLTLLDDPKNDLNDVEAALAAPAATVQPTPQQNLATAHRRRTRGTMPTRARRIRATPGIAMPTRAMPGRAMPRHRKPRFGRSRHPVRLH